MAPIRPATIDDAGRISRLLTELALEYIASEFSELGRRQLLAEFTEPAIAARLASDDYRFHVAENGAVLAGVVSIRRRTHLYYLFVARPQQRIGECIAIRSRRIREARVQPCRSSTGIAGRAVPADGVGGKPIVRSFARGRPIR